MSIMTTAPPLPAIMPPLPVRRFTVDEYHQMIESGILGEDDDVELLEGWIVPKMVRNAVHDGMISIVAIDVLPLRVPQGWFCRAQSAITTSYSEPEPDVTLVRGPTRVYLARHPGPADIALVVEVADSSLARDRSTKAAIYGAARISAYWIINLVDHQVEVYTDPTGPGPQPGYRVRQDYHIGDLVPLIIDGHDYGPIPAQDLLP